MSAVQSRLQAPFLTAAMLNEVEAIEYIAEVDALSGATQPLILTVLRQNNEQVPCYVKINDTTHVNSLVAEAMAAMLAKDLGVSIPEPFIVRWSAEFVESIQNQRVQARFKNCLCPGFGSKKLPAGFRVIPKNWDLNKSSLQPAVQIFLFDALIENPDRGGKHNAKPNCLINGDELAAIDHEKAFSMATTQLLLGRKEPWVLGSMAIYESQESHLFIDNIRDRAISLDVKKFMNKWSGLSDERINAYLQAIPNEWIGNAECAKKMASQIIKIRDNIDACTTELLRVLKVRK